MCGIAGIVDFKGQQVQLDDLVSMTNAIRHRGPDGEGHWINETKNVGLGHRRLSILDLSERGAQPMQYLDDRYSITFNGEIYNYLEIKKKLQEKGYHFTSDTDTEVLLALYSEMGEQCLSEIDGMFAFAIWDEKKQKLFCARDRFGEKPFFYHFKEGRFTFASEMKGIFAAGIERVPDDSLIYTYFIYKSLQQTQDLEKTFFRAIKRLEPSTCLVVEKGSVRKEKYWDVSTEIKYPGIEEAEATERFRDLFYGSVKRRLRSDVAVGSCLSGGLDSSAIVMTIDTIKRQGQTQSTFSARFKNYDKDEGEYMHAIIDRAGLTPYFTWPDSGKLLNDIDEFCRHQEEPVRTASVFAQWEVMKLAKENNVTVLLDGQGADEVMAGYMSYFEDFFRELLLHDRRLYNEERKAYRELFGREFKSDMKFHFITYFPSLYNSWRDLYFKFRPSWIDKDFFRENSSVENPHQRFFKTLNDKLYYRQFHSGLNDLLRFADRNSMAFSREVRLPYLNKDLVEYCMGLPNSYKINKGWTKYILRKSMLPDLPEKIAWRKDKVGFAPPHKRWMKSDKMIRKINAGREKLVEKGILDKHKCNEADPWQVLMVSALYE